jgi:Ni,Fe-hydrogenase III large subunit
MILSDPTPCNSETLAQYIETYCDEGWKIMSLFVSESSPGSTLNILLRRGKDVARITSEVIESYPAIAQRVPSASIFERALWEMSGIVPNGHDDLIPAIYWRKGDGHPLQKEKYNVDSEFRIFKPKNHVSGTGVFEIPVGPVHAGVIEPGHFRFSVAGEQILGLRIHLGYAHKGIEKLMEGPVSNNRSYLADRISGDNAVAHGLAHAHVMEGETEIPARARYIRVILSELERIHNHLDVIAGLCTDAAFVVAAAFGTRIREELLRINGEVFGSRMLMGNIVPGGVKKDISPENMLKLESAVMKAGFAAVTLDGYIRHSPSELDRLETTGILTKEIALRLGAVGIIARASGIISDVRAELPYDAYKDLSFNTISKNKGDVMSREAVRVGEISESVSLILQCIGDMKEGKIWTKPETPNGFSCGIVESPRGELLHSAEIRDGEVWRYNIRDPSFVNWPTMELSVLEDIIPDFPLINKSFGLSYSGNDV